MARKPNNARSFRLEGTASLVARALTHDPSMEVVVSDRAEYDHRNNRMFVPSLDWMDKVAKSLDDNDPVLRLLPDAFRGTLDHECAHKNYSDGEAWDQAYSSWVAEFGPDVAGRMFHLVNVLEDRRIEAKQMADFSGSRSHLLAKRRYASHALTAGEPSKLTDPDFVLPSGSPLGVFGALAATILRLDREEGIPFDQVHPDMQMLVTALAPEIDQGNRATSTGEVIEAARVIWEKLQDMLPPPPPQPDEQPPPPQTPPPPGEQDQPEDSSPNEDDPSDENSDAQDGDEDAQDGDEDAQDGDEDAQDAQDAQDGDEDGEDGEDGEDAQDGDEDGEDAQDGDEDGEDAQDAQDGDEDGEDAQDAQDGDEDGDEDAQDAQDAQDGDEDGEDGEDGDEDGEDGEDAQDGDEGEAAPAAPGAGGLTGESPPQEAAANAIGGDWGEVPTDQDVIASKYLDKAQPVYTVHPLAASCDEVIVYSREQRLEGAKKLQMLKNAAGPAVQKLMAYTRGAYQAATQAMVIGGMEDGDDLDPDALASIALGYNGPDVFRETVQAIQESTFVEIVVDCSGSMGSSEATPYCPKHGRHHADYYARQTDAMSAVEQTTDGSWRCVQPGCFAPMKWQVRGKAGYAAITAMAAHESLAAMRIPHAVHGYNCHGVYSEIPYEQREDWQVSRREMRAAPFEGHPRWSRSSCKVSMHEFVKAPGIHDDGNALPYITGSGANIDGESLLWAAQHAAQEGGNYDRVIMLVIADGLPSGADDSMLEGVYLRQVVEKIANAGIEVYGIGVGIRNMDVFRSYYPDNKGGHGRAPTGSLEIPSGEGLTEPVIRELSDLITRGYGTSRRRR